MIYYSFVVVGFSSNLWMHVLKICSDVQSTNNITATILGSSHYRDKVVGVWTQLKSLSHFDWYWFASRFIQMSELTPSELIFPRLSCIFVVVRESHRTSVDYETVKQ